ncbi:hypothetical protein AVEN_237971-1 [Araneus ventricosus]|uniref:Apolipoprotein L3 n=1 Tax=Araneus ventricosus TaxID=182803 RepID=A0A4Y2G4U5_ARAVE|nr:hypothetical protein AVEN_237971-1 [Araneus ventricosus]
MASSKLARRLYPVKEQFISEEDLKETELLLRNLKCSQSKAASHYEAWVEQRKKSIEAIGRLEKKLVNLHRACNAAHGVGAAMEIVGGVAMIAGAVLTACGHKNVGDFLTKKVSPATGVTGMATAASSSMAEIGLTHMTMKEVKIVLEKDEAYTKMLVENLEKFRKIDSYLRRIFNCSILSNIFLDVVRICQEGISLLDVAIVETSKLDEVLVRLKRKVSKGAGISESIGTAIQNVYTTMKKISNDPKVREAVWNICNIIQQSPSAVEFIKLGLRISFQICDIPRMDIFATLLGFGALKATAGLMATKCLLGTVMVAINVLSVISAVQDAQQEGTSKYSKQLKDLNLALTLELNTVRNNYSKIF